MPSAPNRTARTFESIDTPALVMQYWERLVDTISAAIELTMRIER